jgi:polyisoprenoid-binding protein YceI
MLLALLLAVHLAPAYVVDPAESSLKYTVIHKLHKVEATTNQVEGRAVARGESVLTEVRAQVASFRSGDSNRDEHMDEVMSVGTYPTVVLKGIVPVASGELPQGAARVNAQIELHGVKKAYQIPVTITPRPDGSLRVTSAFDVSLDAHQVDRPSLLFVKIDDACHVDVDVVFREQKP